MINETKTATTIANETKGSTTIVNENKSEPFNIMLTENEEFFITESGGLIQLSGEQVTGLENEIYG